MASLDLSIIFSMVDRVTRPLQGLNTRLTASARALNTLRTQLTTATRAGDAAAIARITAQLERQRRTTDRLARATQSLNRVNATRGALRNGGARALAAGAAGGYAGSKVVGAFMETESAETDLKTAMMRADGSVPAEFEKINKLANDLGNKLPGTTADFQNMMRELNNQGISFKSILGGTGEAAAYMAVQMKMPFAESAAFTAKMLDATQGSEKEILGLMDSIQKGMHLGLSSNDMLDAISSVAPALTTLKMKGKEAADVLMPLIVMAGQNELSGGSAGNAFNKIINRSIDKKTSAKANTELAGTGIKMDFTNKKGEFGGLDKMFSELKKLDKLTSQKRNAYLKAQFGDNSEVSQALGIMMNKGIDGYNETIEKMNAQASLQQRVNAQLGTLANLWDAAGGTFTNLLAHWGSLLAPELKSLTEWLTTVTEKIINWSKENPDLAKGIALATAAIIALTVAGGAFALVLWAISAPLTILMSLFAAPAALVMGIVAGVLALGAALIALYKYWKQVVWFFTTGLGEIIAKFEKWLSEIPLVGNILKLLWLIAKNVFMGFVNSIGAVIYAVIWLGQKIWEIGGKVINAVAKSETFKAVWGGIAAAFEVGKSALSSVNDYVGKVLASSNPVATVWSDIKGLFGGVNDQLNIVAMATQNYFKSLMEHPDPWGKFTSDLRSTFESLFNYLPNLIQSSIKKAVGHLQGLINIVNKVLGTKIGVDPKNTGLAAIASTIANTANTVADDLPKAPASVVKNAAITDNIATPEHKKVIADSKAIKTENISNLASTVASATNTVVNDLPKTPKKVVKNAARTDNIAKPEHKRIITDSKAANTVRDALPKAPEKIIRSVVATENIAKPQYNQILLNNKSQNQNIAANKPAVMQPISNYKTNNSNPVITNNITVNTTTNSTAADIARSITNVAVPKIAAATRLSDKD